MFTIEHDFDGSVVTILDETGTAPDVVITIFDDSVTVEQTDPRTDRSERVVLSMNQIRELQAAIDMPEGSYRLEKR